MVFPMYHTITQSFSAGGGEITMQIVKSASKLAGAFITLYRPPRQGTDPATRVGGAQQQDFIIQIITLTSDGITFTTL